MVVRDLNSYFQQMVTSYTITNLLCMFSLCYLMIKSERSPLRTSFAITQTITIIWLIFALRERISLNHAELLFNMRVCLICINFTAPLWLITILFYTGRLPKKHNWMISAILTVPFALSVPLLSSEYSDIFRLYINDLSMDEYARVYCVNWGPFESIAGINSLCCVILSFCYLLKYFRRNNSIKLFEKIAALIILWSPIIVHYIESLIKSPFDLTPLTFLLWGAVTIYLSFKRQFFNAMPSLVWNIFNIARESMAIINGDGSVNINKTFIAKFGPRCDDFFTFADELSLELSGYIRRKLDVDCLAVCKDSIHYEISIQNFSGRRDQVIGQLITINDVTETKQLTLAEERARIASGLHDSMGNCLIASINNLNLALLQQTIHEVRPFIDTAHTSTIASLMTLRKIVEGLSPVNFDETSLVTLIESVINRLSASGVCADFRISGDPEKLSVDLKEFIYNTCQESLTNSVIHGKAENIIIKLECADMVRLDIVDNGRGCEKISKNNGLTSMETRAKMLNGKIRFGSPSSGGFGIYAAIPVREDNRT